MKRVIITGARGLMGWHALTRLHAENCAANFEGNPIPYDIVALGHNDFDSDDVLWQALKNADAVLHFAGINRASDEEVEFGNQSIAERLVKACRKIDANPHIVYANSTHATRDIPYGRGKKKAADILGDYAGRFTDLILPHIFGENARANYNNVTATLIEQLLSGKTPVVNPNGRVHLLHAGVAAQAAIDAINSKNIPEQLAPDAKTMGVPDLLTRLKNYHSQYGAGVFPDFSDDFDVALFNTYRTATYPSGWPRSLKLHTDSRGTLFEAVKGGGGGQSFLSTTEPGITRGDHFHLNKVERFLVVQGEAVIRVRKVLSRDTWEYPVSGSAPALVDMPTMHTHSIENVGTGPLLTMFWTHDLFDPANPDTYADIVLSP